MNILTTNDLVTVRQHGAMEHTIPPCDLDEVRRYRLARIQVELVRQDLTGLLFRPAILNRVMINFEIANN